MSADDTTIAVDRTGTTVLALAGPDTRRFANGMFTQDLRAPAPGTATSSAWCDDRGRMLGLMRVAATGPDALLLVLQGVDFEAFQARFSRYIVFDDVEMTDHTGEVALITMQGPRAGAVLHAAGSPAPEGWEGEAPFGVLRHDRLATRGFDLLVPRAEAAATLAALEAAGAVVATAADLETRRVLAGQPAWPDDMDDHTFPHELGLRDEVLSFEKGCYVGQEIINRMDTFAKVRRVLVGVVVDGEEVPPAGAEVRVAGKRVGRLTSPVRAPGVVVGLCVIRREHEAPGTEVEVADGERIWRGTVAVLPLAGAVAKDG